jgi:tetratricopeptide (TPR) repeat protein
MLEADKAQRDIVKQAEEQIKRILDKSTYRQNFYDTLTRIANEPDFGRQVQEYTHFLRTSGDIEGINYAYVYICRGNAYLMLSRDDKALSDFEMAAKLDTKTVVPFFALGHYYVTKKDYLKSIEIYKEGLKIDRIDNDGNYEPNNCQWVSSKQNSRNRRQSKLDKDKVDNIKEMLKNKIKQKHIALKYNVDDSCISKISKGKIWA